MASKSETKKRPPFSWAQPVCSQCWVGMKVKIGRLAPSLKGAQFCCYCRDQIQAGEVYLQRINPNATPYPTLRKEEEE